jgi:hypothetical protein
MIDMPKISRTALLLATVAIGTGGAAAAEPLLDPGTGHVVTPNHDPHHLTLAVATPNHDPRRMDGLSPDMASLAAEAIAANPEPQLAGPEVAAPPAPSFIAADAMLLAKANARLRAAPSTAAGVLKKLAANAPLHAVARSSDGLWWRVALADKRVGYVHRDAVTRDLVARATAPASMPPTTVAAASSPPSARRAQGVLGYVNDAMNWLTDMAYRPSRPQPRVSRSER